MQAAHGAGLAGSGMVDLRDLAAAEQGLKFIRAEEADERAAGIAVGQGLHNLQACHWGVEDVHGAAQPALELTASAMPAKRSSWR
jgi:hypothetical protein